MGDRRVLENAVTEIEDVRPPGEGVKDALHRVCQAPRRRQAAPAGRDCPGPASPAGSSLAAQTGSTVSSRPIASTPVSRA